RLRPDFFSASGRDGHGRSRQGRGHHGRRHGHRTRGGAGAAGRRLERGRHRPPQGGARQDGGGGQVRRGQDPGGGGRHQQGRRRQARVRRDQEDVRAARLPVQQRGLRRPARADGDAAGGDLEVGGGYEPDGLVPVRAGGHPHVQGTEAA